MKKIVIIEKCNDCPHFDNEYYDDYVFLSDEELGRAPVNPGTYEGNDCKPKSTKDRLNKWCARECERSKLIEANTEFNLCNFSTRIYNKGERYEKESQNQKAE